MRALESYTNLEVSGQTTSDWYCLLRECQGSSKRVLDSGYIDNSNGYQDVQISFMNIFTSWMLV